MGRPDRRGPVKEAEVREHMVKGDLPEQKEPERFPRTKTSVSADFKGERCTRGREKQMDSRKSYP